jgi:hypothetical protein
MDGKQWDEVQKFMSAGFDFSEACHMVDPSVKPTDPVAISCYNEWCNKPRIITNSFDNRYFLREKGK